MSAFGLLQGLYKKLAGGVSNLLGGGGQAVPLPDLYTISWERVDGSGEITEISLDNPLGENAIETKDKVKRFLFRSVTEETWKSYETGKPRWRTAVWKNTEPKVGYFNPRSDPWPVNRRSEARIPISGDGWDE